jgi:hypothetical protein
LLVAGLGRRRHERGAAMLARWPGRSPRPTRGREVRTDRRRDLRRRHRTRAFGRVGGENGRDVGREVRGGRIGRMGGSDGNGHRAKDTGRPAPGRPEDESAVSCPRTRKNPGDDLFSRKAALSVSSALESLTSVFGMGTGMASPPVSPGFVASGCCSAATAAGP